MIYSENYIDVELLFIEHSIGISTGNDIEFVSFDKNKILEKYNSVSSFYNKPFDFRFAFFDNSILQNENFIKINNYNSEYNYVLNLIKNSDLKNFGTLISNSLTSIDFISKNTCNFPLYCYPKNTNQTTLKNPNGFQPIAQRIPNLNSEIVQKIATILGLTFTNEVEQESEVCFANSRELRPEFRQTFAPIDILDYIYAVLHSPTYREKYKEFLKIDFPRVPYPKELTTFQNLVKLGAQLRQIHLLESETIENYITQYPISGNNEVGKIRFVANSSRHPELVSGSKKEMLKQSRNLSEQLDNDENGNVFINETQYFANVPEIAWNFYIGGYQPAQKWLKDRKGRTLDFEDILHYQKIIVALSETDRLMKEIDKIAIVCSEISE